MKIVLATENQGKVEELKRLLPHTIEVLSLQDVGLDSPIEDGSTFAENARIKAVHAASSGYMAIADDSGLCVDALGGRPGVRSSRFAGDSATDQQNNSHLLKCLAHTSNRERIARFTSAVILIDELGSEYQAVASLEGFIVDLPRGTNGFGYDSLFEVRDPEDQEFNGRTLAELTLIEKNVISHRARAYDGLIRKLFSASSSNPNLLALIPDEFGVGSS